MSERLGNPEAPLYMLEDQWREALWKYKNNSSAPYGDYPDDLIEIVVAQTGMTRPEPGSELENYISVVLSGIEKAEQDDLERDRERGYIADDEDELPPEVQNIGEHND